MIELNQYITEQSEIVIISVFIIGLALYFNFLCCLTIIKNYKKIDVKPLRFLYHILYFLTLGYVFHHLLETDHINIMILLMSIPMMLHIMKDYVALGSYIQTDNNMESYKKIENIIQKKGICIDKIVNLVSKTYK